MTPFGTGQHEPEPGPPGRAARPGAPPRLSIAGLSKTFGSARVLRQVCLEVAAGEVHCLVGHNGSGKLTLVKVLAGVYPPDPGCVIGLDGAALRLPVHARDLASAGISFVHQDLGLVDGLSVTENCRIGRFTARRLSRRVNWPAEHEQVRAALARLGSSLDPCAPVGSLPAAERSTVAIARAIGDQVPGQGVIVLDEATRALPRPAQEHLYGLIEGIAAAGGAVLMITHRVDEVFRLAARVSVLRDGELIAGGVHSATLDQAALGQLLAGPRDNALNATPRSLSQAASVSDAAPSSAAGRAPSRALPPKRGTVRTPGGRIHIAGLTGRALAGLSFEVAQGEVLGVTGLLGSGLEELPALVTGARRAAAGQLSVPGGTIDLARPALHRCLDAGVVLVPERRDTEGLALPLSVRDNLAVPLLRRHSRPWWVRRGWEDELALRTAADLGIRPGHGQQPVGQLSGGNRQKALFGKWLATGPQLLVLHEPAQGVHVGARAQLLALVRRAAASGVAIIMASIEAEDLAIACDRVLILRGGHIAARLARPCDAQEIVRLTYQEPTPSHQDPPPEVAR